MAYDLLNIQNDVYAYEASQGSMKEVRLSRISLAADNFISNLIGC